MFCVNFISLSYDCMIVFGVGAAPRVQDGRRLSGRRMTGPGGEVPTSGRHADAASSSSARPAPGL